MDSICIKLRSYQPITSMQYHFGWDKEKQTGLRTLQYFINQCKMRSSLSTSLRPEH